MDIIHHYAKYLATNLYGVTMTHTSEDIKQEIADLKSRLADKERLLVIQEALEAAMKERAQKLLS